MSLIFLFPGHINLCFSHSQHSNLFFLLPGHTDPVGPPSLHHQHLSHGCTHRVRLSISSSGTRTHLVFFFLTIYVRSFQELSVVLYAVDSPGWGVGVNRRSRPTEFLPAAAPQQFSTTSVGSAPLPGASLTCPGKHSGPATTQPCTGRGMRWDTWTCLAGVMPYSDRAQYLGHS
jgi:hypothetical protein